MTEKTASRVLGYRRTIDGVIWPRTAVTWCAYFRALDVIYKNDPSDIPLGHDYRCPIHGHKPRRPIPHH